MDADKIPPEASAEITIKSESEFPAVTPGRTVRYKQCYRKKWESMPDFKGWLRSVPNEPTRAYCAYCDKSLHAHRLSLLKHTCTLKHTKAAQAVFTLQQMAKREVSGNIKTLPIQDPAPGKQTEEDVKDEESVDDVEPTEPPMVDSSASTKRQKMDNSPAPPAAQVEKSPLSTHVLDTAKGVPVGGLQVSLYKLVAGRWTLMHEGFTHPDGRYSDFIHKADFTAGRYKLHFDVDRYFELRRVESLYPFIEIAFDVKSPQDHYHVPLLLSPFGFSTYRGN